MSSRFLAYARQFLERIEKPDVDHMDGLAPAIAIKQKNQTRNPRSTVATATEIYDYMRLLYARCGTVTCLHCGGIVKRDTVDEIATAVLALGDDTRLFALFPIERRTVVLEPMQEFALPPEEVATKPAAKAKEAREQKGREGRCHSQPVVDPTEPMRERLVELRRRGYNRLYQNGSVVEFSTPESLLELNFSEPIYVLADRLSVSADVRARIVDAIETGYRESGEIILLTAPRDGSEPQRLRFSAAFECENCHRAYRDPEPRLFSFNNPFGACPRCQGFGNTIDFDPDLIIPDKARSLEDGAVDPWTRPKYRAHHGEMKRFAQAQPYPAEDRVVRPDTRAADADLGRRQRLQRHSRLFPLARQQEVQAACARVPGEVSRLCAMPRLPRAAAACRGARGAAERPQHL